MHSIQFELTHAGSLQGRLGRMGIHVWSGSVPGLGPVELTSPAETDAQREELGAWVSGHGIPPMTFWGYGFRELPRLARISLTADGWTGKVKRRHLAVTARGRALRIEIAGRSYRYQVLDGKCRHELRREGAVVTMTRSQWRHPRSISGIAQGNADGLDIGLAVLLEGAYTRNLSFSGALYSWPGRFLSRLDVPDF
ncbi:hypothetical protein OG264_04170 [Streptomyces xanthophaeus]|uniref:hypothetical protein n=1 Tax=Streptomyces xanthophaeus TaxID=67385 RepID=UPI003865E82B|nr:hypothetical protein OG264_04170 [Streptomyces xanthophaeus]WST64251.1 hypothetical protein OG605_34190 [Streptomyces xanthophaeus]